jgi:hypothetical protein
MPRQNRVTPVSTLIATPARGQWLGNRGCLHDEAGRIRRLYQTRRWIICRLEFKGVRRPLMQPGRWTELFFLDEATAFAAGHRPCAYCQRPRYDEFRRAWAAANPQLGLGARPSADQIDAVLHAERLDAQRQRRTYPGRLDTLPDGAFVLVEGQACLVRGGRLWPWQPEGYAAPVSLPPDTSLDVLTPRSVVNALAQGFGVQMGHRPP